MFARVDIEKNLRKMYMVKSVFTKVFPRVITGTRRMQYKYNFIFFKWIKMDFFMND